jgi:hypothetical protein
MAARDGSIRIGSGPIKFKKIMPHAKIKRKKIKNISNLMFA